VFAGGAVTIRSQGSASLAGRRHRTTDLIQPRDPLLCPPYLVASPKDQTLCLSGVVIKQHYFKKCFIDPIKVYTRYPLQNNFHRKLRTILKEEPFWSRSIPRCNFARAPF